MSNEPIRCPECGKTIGEYVQIGIMKTKAIGAITMLDAKYDDRKVSKISFGTGMLCKACAGHFFPDGKAYIVKVLHGNGWIQPFVGIRQSGMYMTRSEADKMASEMNKKPKIVARVEEKEI